MSYDLYMVYHSQVRAIEGLISSSQVDGFWRRGEGLSLLFEVGVRIRKLRCQDNDVIQHVYNPIHLLMPHNALCLQVF